jgi:hypothetical protein
MSDNPLSAYVTTEVLWLITIGVLAILVILALVATFVIVARLSRMERGLSRLNASVYRLVHPELPWPPVSPETVVHWETRDGLPLRMRADGTWEARDRGKWEPIP